MNDRIAELLALPPSSLVYHVDRFLSSSGRIAISTEAGAFQLAPFAAAGECEARPKKDAHQQNAYHWFDGTAPRFYVAGENTWFDVTWRGRRFEVLQLSWFGARELVTRRWIVADTQALAEELFTEVCRFNTELREEVLVFEGGCWTKDEELFASIQSATLETLVLPAGVKDEIAGDLQAFFAAKSIYEEHGVPWKRGILFSGPPGNGKTLALKALVRHLRKPCLYVKSFEAKWSSAHDSIRSVFQRARAIAPCILVFEDLDALISPTNKSYFLNELDGFAKNEGVLSLATTNWPERLDPAIRDRPSRFDRTYSFALPGPTERASYIAMWNETLKSALRLAPEHVELIALATGGFSYAYLKELFFSSMMKWISSGRGGAMLEIMQGQAALLDAQMAAAGTAPEEPVAPPSPPAVSRLEEALAALKF